MIKRKTLKSENGVTLIDVTIYNCYVNNNRNCCFC